VTAIAIIASLRHKRRVSAAAREVIRWLEQQRVEARLQGDLATALRREDLAVADERLMDGVSLALSLGGDGAMLATTRLAAPRGTPILGCNLGGFGFLTELTESELMPALPRVLAGDYRVRDRMMIECELVRAGDAISTPPGLNDVAITRGASPHLPRLEIQVGAESLGALTADGLVIATSTGSTAYSLAAGGPLVSPEVEALVVTPICAHTLSARPVVAPGTTEIAVRLAELQPGQHVGAVIDGQDALALESGDIVRVRKAAVAAHFIRLDGPGFIAKVRSRLDWASRS